MQHLRCFSLAWHHVFLKGFFLQKRMSGLRDHTNLWVTVVSHPQWWWRTLHQATDATASQSLEESVSLLWPTKHCVMSNIAVPSDRFPFLKSHYIQYFLFTLIVTATGIHQEVRDSSQHHRVIVAPLQEGHGGIAGGGAAGRQGLPQRRMYRLSQHQRLQVIRNML